LGGPQGNNKVLVRKSFRLKLRKSSGAIKLWLAGL
jgi:hypothetical protein